MTWQNRNPYELLEVDQSATIEEIERAKKLQLTAWHPDKFPAGEFKQIAVERTQRINGAYKILRDEEMREQLDRSFESDQEIEYTPQFEDNKMNIPENWKSMSSFMKGLGLGTPRSRSFAYSVADQYLEKRRPLTQEQLIWALQIWSEAVQYGFRP